MTTSLKIEIVNPTPPQQNTKGRWSLLYQNKVWGNEIAYSGEADENTEADLFEMLVDNFNTSFVTIRRTP